MNGIEFFNKYFPLITLVIVILLAIFIIASILNFNFEKKKNQTLTKKVSFDTNI